MAENLFCEERECGQLARVFALVSGKKVRACSIHIENLMQKSPTVYEIAAYAFIETSEDTQLYEKRKHLMELGLGNLSQLETECNRGWEEGKKTLTEAFNAMNAVMQKSFQEMQQRGQKQWEEMKQDLEEIRSHLLLFARDRSFQLSPEERALCESVPTGPVFHVYFGDCRVSVAETLLGNLQVLAWDVQQESDWRLRVKQFLSNKEATLKKNEETSHQLRSLLASPAEREAADCLKAGIEARNAQNFDRAIEKLQRGRDLTKGTDDAALCLELSNSLAETYCMTERWEDTLRLCQETLGTWGETSHYCELLKALFYLSQSLYQLKQEAQGYEIVEEWTRKLKAESPRSQCVLLCIQTITLRQQGEMERAAELYKTAVALDQSFSYIIASSRCPLSSTNKPLINKQMVPPLKRCSRWFCCFPLCILIMGLLTGGLSPSYQEVTDFIPSEDYEDFLLTPELNLYEMNVSGFTDSVYLKVVNVYAIHFPQSQDYANCLYSLGVLYDDMSKYAYSEETYLEAIHIYSAHFPQSQDYANCLNNLGVLYLYIGMWKHADSEKMFRQAIHIYSADFSQSQGYADCLENLRIVEMEIIKQIWPFSIVRMEANNKFKAVEYPKRFFTKPGAIYIEILKPL